MFIKIFPALMVSFLLFLPSKKGFPQKSPEPPLLPFNLCWQNQTENSVFKSIASDNVSKIYLAAIDGSLEAFDLSKGEKLWKSETGNPNVLEISSVDGNVSVLSGEDYILTVISSETGLIISKKKAEEADIENFHSKKLKSRTAETQKLLSETVGINLLMIADEKGSIKLLDSNSKKPLWSMKVGARVSSLTYLRGEKQRVAVTSFDNFVYMISVRSGGKIWKKRLPGRITENPLSDEKFLIFGVAGEKAAFVLDTESGNQIGKIEIKDDNYLIRPLLKIKDKFLFQTAHGLALFTQNNCSE